MKKVLIITYYFLPEGLSAVRRISNFERGLTEHGFGSIILTAEPIRDELKKNFNMAGDGIPRAGNDTCTVRTIPTFENNGIWKKIRTNKIIGYLLNLILLPDIQVMWVAAAVRAGLRLIRAERIDLIYISSQPYSTQFAGWLLSRLTGVPWCAEFRDPWTRFFLKTWPSRLTYVLDRMAEKFIYRRAAAIIVATPRCKDELLADNPFVAAGRVHVVTNGYSAEDFSGLPPAQSASLFTLAFVGRSYWPYRPGSLSNARKRWGVKNYYISPVDFTSTTPYYFFQGLRRLLEQHPQLRGVLRVAMVGSIWPSERELIRELGLDEVVAVSGFVTHTQAVATMRAAQALVYILGQSERPLYTVAGRLYEYLASDKPVLALVPEGDSRDILVRARVGCFAPPTDAAGIARVIFDLYSRWQQGTLRMRADPEVVQQFEYRRLSQRVAEILSGICRPEHI